MESKIEIELTEKEASHLRTLLEGGIKISDSISQGEVFKNILDHLNSQDQEEEILKDTKLVSSWVHNGKKWKEYTQEGWKEVNKDIWYMVGGKKYVNINGEEYIRTSDLEQLLDEREREWYLRGLEDIKMECIQKMSIGRITPSKKDELLREIEEIAVKLDNK